ncbi:flavin reductase family protein [Streptosporangium sp. NPDC002607]
MLLRIDPAGGGSVSLEDPDDLTRLKIVARSDARESAVYALQRDRVGVMATDGTALVDPDALRRLSGDRVGPGWEARFADMLRMAGEVGWTAPDGRLFVHTDWVTGEELGLGAEPPVDRDELRRALGRFATGVVVAAAVGAEGPVGLACQSFTSLSLDPPLVSLAPARTSKSWPQIAATGTFCVSVLTEEQLDVCQRFAVSGGDKFAGLSWHPSSVTGSPVIDDCLAWVDCRIELVHSAGDHELVIGRVLALDAAGGRPLVFFASRFAQLAPAGTVT